MPLQHPYGGASTGPAPTVEVLLHVGVLMTENGTKPPIIEGPGRYVVYQAAESWKIARATGICETCQNCGCGEQQEVVDLPDFSKGPAAVMSWAMKNQDGGILSKLRAMVGGR